MHGNDKLGLDQSAALLRVGEHPYAAQNFVGEAALLEDLLGLVTGEGIVDERLALEQDAVLRDLLGGQGRDADGTTGRLCMEGRWGRRGRCDRWRREAIESRELGRLEGQLGGRFAAGLGVADEAEDDSKPCAGQKATVLLVGNLPDLRAMRSARGRHSEGREFREFMETDLAEDPRV